MTAAGTYIVITVTDGAGAALPDFDKVRGAVEFWFQPTWASTDNNIRDLAGLISSVANNEILFQKLNNAGGNNLLFRLRANAVNSDCQVSGATYSWTANEWVHLHFEWDETAPAASQQKIYVNGVLKPCTATPTDYVAANLNLGTNGAFWVGNINNGANFSGFGIYDELHVYGGSSAPSTPLANGGLIGSSSEYLADGANNLILSFSGVDAVDRGEYLYLGADSQFRGLNVGLKALGIGTADLQWQYWNGSSWADLETVGGFTDTTSSLKKSGNLFWQDPPTWTPYSVNGGPDLYFIRAFVTSGSYRTPPTEGLITTDILLFQYCGDITAAAQEFVFAAPIPTAVTLQSFEANAADGAVDLAWTTASELRESGLPPLPFGVGRWTLRPDHGFPDCGPGVVAHGNELFLPGRRSGERPDVLLRARRRRHVRPDHEAWTGLGHTHGGSRWGWRCGWFGRSGRVGWHGRRWEWRGERKDLRGGGCAFPAGPGARSVVCGDRAAHSRLRGGRSESDGSVHLEVPASSWHSRRALPPFL